MNSKIIKMHDEERGIVNKASEYVIGKQLRYGVASALAAHIK
jgi:hypothetical protein